MPAPGAYSFRVLAAPPPGYGGSFGTIDYRGPNDLSGGIDTASPFGITGTDTPLHPGGTYGEIVVLLGVMGNSGWFDVGSDFTGGVSFGDVGPTGGTFGVMGYFSRAVASYFGIATDQAFVGVASLQLSDSVNGAKIGQLQLTLTPTVPEPSSVIATATGLVFAAGFARRRLARTVATPTS